MKEGMRPWQFLLFYFINKTIDTVSKVWYSM